MALATQDSRAVAQGNGRNAAPTTIKDLLYKAKDSIQAVTPKHMDVEKLIKVALVTINRTPTLAKCSPMSLLECVMTASQLGLDVGGVLGSAYLVPYSGKCTLIVGYRGLIDLARRSGQIESIEARVVYENDEFECVYGLDPVLTHKPQIHGLRGDIMAVYAIARLKGGERALEVMTRDEIDAIKHRSKSGGNGPWVTDYSEMARKTVVRRLCKYLPLSPDMIEAIVESDKAEFGDPAAALGEGLFTENADANPNESEAEPISSTDALAAKLAANTNGETE